MYVHAYSGTPLIWTLIGQEEVSILVRYPCISGVKYILVRCPCISGVKMHIREVSSFQGLKCILVKCPCISGVKMHISEVSLYLRG